MKTVTDEEIVTARLEPVGLSGMLAALRDAGFSGSVYRASSPDLDATLEDDEAGALHFLRHGFAESRIFPTRLELAGLKRLQRMPVRNRVYLQNLLVALVTAWTGVNIRGSADLTTHASTIEQFRTMGGMPLLILGDATAGLYRRGASSGERWICPLAVAPLEGGIEALSRLPPHMLLAPGRDPHQDPMPTLWKFGQSDVQMGYPAHRRRQGIGPGDTHAFLAFAAPLIRDYATFLAAAVPVRARPEHWIASLLPPVPSAADEPPAPGVGLAAPMSPDTLVDRTGMYGDFNRLLEKTVVELGFNVVRNFDCFLAASGTVDEHYQVTARDSDDLDFAATRAVISTSLWTIIDGSRTVPPPVGIRDQFEQLLEEIRMVQMGQSPG